MGKAKPQVLITLPRLQALSKAARTFVETFERYYEETRGRPEGTVVVAGPDLKDALGDLVAETASVFQDFFREKFNEVARDG